MSAIPSGGYEYILFDLDGTISESGPGITRCAQYALRAFGIDEPDLKKLEVFVGPPLNVTFQQYYGFNEEESAEAVRIFQERYDREGVFENALYPGIEAMLRELRAAGKHLAIASSKPRHLIPMILDRFGIREYFEVISAPGFEQELTGKMESDNKSHMVRQALEELGLVPPASTESGRSGAAESPVPDLRERAAMVGDRFYDIRGALANQVTAVGVTYGYGSRGELLQAGADLIADSPQELCRLLLGR